MTLRIARLLAAIGVCAAVGGLLFMASKAQAQSAPPCGDLATMVDHLKEKYGEVVVWSGIREVNGVQVRTFLFQSPANTWTLIAAQGTTGCILGTGEQGTQVITGRDA